MAETLDPPALGGKVKLPLVGKGFATVGVGPGSALGSMSAGRKPRRGRRWGWKRVGLVVARGVRVDINRGKWDWGRDGRVSSMGYRRDRDWASWCASEEDRYAVEARRAASRT